MKSILQFILPYKKYVLWGFLLMAIQTAASLVLPYFMGAIVDNGIEKGDMSVVWQNGVNMIILTGVGFVASLVCNKLNSKAGTYATGDMRKEIFRRVNKLTVGEFSHMGPAEFLTRSTEDTWVAQEVIIGFSYCVIAIPVFFLGGTILTFRRDAVLSLVIFASVPLIVLLICLLSKNIWTNFDKSDQYIDIQNKIVRERLTGIRVIRAFDTEDKEHKRIEHATKEMANHIIKANVLGNLIDPTALFLLNIATVVIMFLGGVKIRDGLGLTTGDLISIVQYVSLIANAILMLSFFFVFLPRVRVAMKRIQEIFNLSKTAETTSSGEKLSGDVRFENVSFSYGDGKESAVTDLNMEINDGEIVGVIGGTGSGKTTFLRLLLRFFEPTSGQIVFGGKTAKEVTPETVRDNVSVALQKVMIFMGTVRENVKMGKPEATDEEMINACKIAQIDDFISAQKEGYDYELTQNGANLSGGQKQRINMARAIIKDASIYVFDDSFSALDYLTEANLRRALNTYLQGKTQIIITQRAATAMRCDKVYVMDEGKIVGCGKHADLLVNCPIYKEIYDSQLGGKEGGVAQ